MEYLRISPDIDSDPDLWRAGWWATRVYELLLKVSALRDLCGLLAVEHQRPEWLAHQWGLKAGETPPGLTPEAVVEAGLARLIEVRALVPQPDGALYIKGWGKFYKEPKTGAQRTQEWRERQKAKDSGPPAECVTPVTKPRHSDATPPHSTPLHTTPPPPPPPPPAGRPGAATAPTGVGVVAKKAPLGPPPPPPAPTGAPPAPTAERAWQVVLEVVPEPPARPPGGWSGWWRRFCEEYPEDTEYQFRTGLERAMRPDSGLEGRTVRVFMNPDVYGSRVPPPRTPEERAEAASQVRQQPLPEGLEAFSLEAWRRVRAEVDRRLRERCVAALGETASAGALREARQARAAELDQVEPKGRLGDDVYLEAKDDFVRDFVRDQYGAELEAALGCSVRWRVGA